MGPAASGAPAASADSASPRASSRSPASRRQRSIAIGRPQLPGGATRQLASYSSAARRSSVAACSSSPTIAAARPAAHDAPAMPARRKSSRSPSAAGAAARRSCSSSAESRFADQSIQATVCCKRPSSAPLPVLTEPSVNAVGSEAMEATRFALERLDTRVGPVGRLTMANGSGGRRPHTFGEEALRSLDAALGRLRTRDWRGLLVTGEGSSFGAGADIDAFPGITADRAREGSRAGHELFGRLRELPFATLAAINGGALGGGLELALHCDVRTVAANVRHLGFPEVFLGLVPAWGGTQLAPRLLGAEAAVRLVVESPLRQNRMLDAQQALEVGLVDAVFEPDELLDRSLEFLLERVEAGAGKPRPEADLSDVADVVRRTRARVDDVVHGQAPAPYRALELLEGAARWTLEEGLRAEEDAVAELLPGPEAQASLYAFDVVERRLERLAAIPHVEPRPIGRVGIVGAGLMATQLATLFLRRLELPVVLTDVDPERAPRAVEAIRGEVDGLVAKGRLDEERAERLRRLALAGTGIDDYAGCDLVLEAVFEELEAKRDVFRALEKVVTPECLLATNTSALSVTAMAEGLTRPE